MDSLTSIQVCHKSGNRATTIGCQVKFRMLERVVLAKLGAPSSITLGRPVMQTGLATGFSHVKPLDTSFTRGGLRGLFAYRDLEIVSVTRWSRNFLGQVLRRSWAQAGTGMRQILKSSACSKTVASCTPTRKRSSKRAIACIRRRPLRTRARHGVHRNREPCRIQIGRRGSAVPAPR